MAEKPKAEVFKGPDLKAPEVALAPVAGKIHVDLFLHANEVPLWERGGKKAFAIAKGKETATEADFKTLFKSY